jgi:hypothetical protein
MICERSRTLRRTSRFFGFFSTVGGVVIEFVAMALSC